MREQTFFKIRKTLNVLLFVSFLILGTIPFVVLADPQVANNDDWITSVTKNEGVVGEDIKNAYAADKKEDWESLSINGDKIATDSQAAIDTSNSIGVTPRLQSIKDEYNFAMEQAKQVGIYMHKAAEEAKNGNWDGGIPYMKTALQYEASYKKHRESVNYALMHYYEEPKPIIHI